MIIFITGGSKGLGGAMVERFATNGHTVIFTYNSSGAKAEQLHAKHPSVSAYCCDLRDYHRCEEVAKAVKEHNGNIDVLINNAGYDKDATFSKMDKNTWDDVLGVNLGSIFNFTHFFLPLMIENKWGRIVNLTSIAGFTGAFGKSNYAAAKAGIVGFTKSLAMEVASKGVTVNAIAPGAIETDMLNRIPEKYREKILENIPAKRFGEPEEVADLVEFLVSNKASYITGQTIHINGGSYL